jgi:AraC family transcriptional regulator
MAVGPCSAASYLLQKQLIHSLQAEALPDALQVEEESVLSLLEDVLRSAQRAKARRTQKSSQVSARHAALAQQTKLILVQHYKAPLKLSIIAKAAGTSPYHMARVFREQTGWSLHGYRMQLRLNAALDLGFSSHSHFTSSFKHAFGSPASKLRPRAPKQ